MRGKFVNRRVQPVFSNKTAGRGSSKPGPGRQCPVLPRTSELLKTEVCGKFRNTRPHRPFRAKKPQVDALSLLHALSIFKICRILPIIRLLQANYFYLALKNQARTLLFMMIWLHLTYKLSVAIMGRSIWLETMSLWNMKIPEAGHSGS